MSIRVNLPDGSVANFPAGMNPQQIQAEIEQYMAQSAQQPAPQRRVMTPGQEIARDVSRLRDTIGRGDEEFQENFDWQGEPQQPRQREIPLNAMEQQAQMEAQRRGPQRRNAEISIRDAIEPESQRYQPPRPQRKDRAPQVNADQEPQGYQQPTFGATELSQPAMRDAVRGREAPASEVNTDRGPQRRRSEISIREALPQQSAAEDQFQENYDWQGDPASRPDEQPAKDPATMTDAELRAAEIAARNPIGNFGRGIADTFRGATRAAASASQDALGGAAAALGMPGVGSRLMQGADDIEANLESRRALEAEERAAADAQAQRFAEERARRQGQTAAPASDAAPTTPPAQSQPAAGLPSVQNPNAGQRTNVAMPQGLSIQGAREQGRGESAMTFNMGDGQTVQVRAAPPAAMKNGVKTGMDFLMERADQVTLKMLQNGDIAGATAFRDFVRGEQAQKGMSYMNRAVIASSYGDSAAFTSSLDRMVKAFDPDGDWQIDTKGTRLIQTDNGQAVGAMLSLRNKTTGEVMEQEYMGMQNVIAALSDFGSPTAAYERQKERVAGAVAQKIANAASYQEAFDKAMADMFDKASFVDYDGNAIGQEEMQRRQQMVIERIRAVRPDLVPANAAPVAPPPAASGVGSSIRSFFGGSTGDKPVPTMEGM
jgi:hypothetical protein